MKLRSNLFIYLCTLSLFALSNWAFAGTNLVTNGDFEDPEDPFKGWCLDWKWDGNVNHANNQQGFSIVKSDGSKKNAMRMGSDLKEPLFMSPLVKYTPGKKYKVSFDCRGTENGEGLRVYIRGFKWKSGIRPYENPHWGDLTLAYRQGTVITCTGGPQINKEIYSRIKNTWTTVSFEFPPFEKSKPASEKPTASKTKTSGKKPSADNAKPTSEMADKTLATMRFFCLYGVYAGGYFPPGKSEFLIDNLVIEELK